MPYQLLVRVYIGVTDNGEIDTRMTPAESSILTENKEELMRKAKEIVEETYSSDSIEEVCRTSELLFVGHIHFEIKEEVAGNRIESMEDEVDSEVRLQSTITDDMNTYQKPTSFTPLE